MHSHLLWPFILAMISYAASSQPCAPRRTFRTGDVCDSLLLPPSLWPVCLDGQVRVELIKIIRQHKLPHYKLENHRPRWLVENHRLHFLLPTHGNAEAGLMLIDGTKPDRTAVDRLVPVQPHRTTAVHPDTKDVVDPIGVLSPQAVVGAAAFSAVGETAGAIDAGATAAGPAVHEGAAVHEAGTTGAPETTAKVGAPTMPGTTELATAASDAASVAARAAAKAFFASGPTS